MTMRRRHEPPRRVCLSRARRHPPRHRPHRTRTLTAFDGYSAPPLPIAAVCAPSCHQHGDTPLSDALGRNRTEVAALLRERGAC